MKYAAPYGSPDPNAPYVDRDTPGAIRGSTPPGRAVEHPQREIQTVIEAAGLVPNPNDTTQLNQAIDQKILEVTGGGGDENYVLMTQARARMPIHVEVNTADGRLPFTSPVTGQLRVPGGYTFDHRGIYRVTTVEQDFATAANKTYHLRWNPTDGWALKDLADSGYNAGALAETSAVFDRTFDDVLFARVITSPSNVLAITSLANKARLMLSAAMTASDLQDSGGQSARCLQTLDYNWASTPQLKAFTRTYIAINEFANDRDELLYSSYPSSQVYEIPATRYGMSFVYMVDSMNGLARLQASIAA